MSDNTKVKHLLEELSDKTIAYRPTYSLICGNPMAGLLLSQLMYWGVKVMQGKEFYKKDSELCSELGFSISNLTTAREYLKKTGLVEITRKGIPAKLYYKVNIDSVIDSITSYWKSKNRLLEIQEQVPVNPRTSSCKSNNIIVQESTQESTQESKEEREPPLEKTKKSDLAKKSEKQVSSFQLSSVSPAEDKARKPKKKAILTKDELKVLAVYQKLIFKNCKETTPAIIVNLPKALEIFKQYYPEDYTDKCINAITNFSKDEWFKKIKSDLTQISRLSPSRFLNPKFIENNLLPLTEKLDGNISDNRPTEEELRDITKGNIERLRKWKERTGNA